MQQDGVETRPIRLISGISPFCETYFTDARAEKGDLLGNLNDGWSVVKLVIAARASEPNWRAWGESMLDSEPLHLKAQRFVGTDDNGALVDKDLRQRLVRNYMDGAAHRLTAQRITDEASGRVEVSAAASILKNSNTRFTQQKAELALEIMGSQGIGWSGDDFAEEELGIVREWLSGKAMSIYGGSLRGAKQHYFQECFGFTRDHAKRISHGSVNRRTIDSKRSGHFLGLKLNCLFRNFASSATATVMAALTQKHGPPWLIWAGQASWCPKPMVAPTLAI